MQNNIIIKSISDFAPDGKESGVGLALPDDDSRYLFILPGTRYHLPPGEMFYAGIGGHLEMGEDWLMCAHREAKEEIGIDIDIIPAQVTWYIPQQGSIQQVKVKDQPQPFALYEMLHGPDTPRAGKIYRIVIYNARLHDIPKNLPTDEVQGVIAMTKEQVVQGLKRKLLLAELLDKGAALIVGENSVDPQTRIYPLGTANALAQIFSKLDEES